MDQEKKRMGRPPIPRKRTAYVQVRCYPEWLAWLNQVAQLRGVSNADVLEEGARMWAARRKDLPPMPER
jgi:hypothetical protein